MTPVDAKVVETFTRLLERNAAHRPFVFDRRDPDRLLVDCHGTVMLIESGSHSTELLDAMELSVMEANAR